MSQNQLRFGVNITSDEAGYWVVVCTKKRLSRLLNNEVSVAVLDLLIKAQFAFIAKDPDPNVAGKVVFQSRDWGSMISLPVRYEMAQKLRQAEDQVMVSINNLIGSAHRGVGRVVTGKIAPDTLQQSSAAKPSSPKAAPKERSASTPLLTAIKDAAILYVTLNLVSYLGLALVSPALIGAMLYAAGFGAVACLIGIVITEKQQRMPLWEAAAFGSLGYMAVTAGMSFWWLRINQVIPAIVTVGLLVVSIVLGFYVETYER